MADSDKWAKLLQSIEPEPPKFCPHEPTVKQKAFLKYEGLEALYGGAAGGGKSDCLLMSALQYVHIPGYSAILFRRNYTDLTLPEAILDRSHQWLDEVEGVKWQQSKSWWLFPSGARLAFGYLDKPNDHLRYKGMEVQFIGYDELTEIRREHYQYMFSRLRKPSGNVGLSQVPLRVRSATNPAPNWVRERFIENPYDADLEHTRLFIPAGAKDNPFIDQKAYLRSLAQLTSVERARLEDGDWYAEEEGAMFSREWFNVIKPQSLPDEAFDNIVRYWDTASTEPTESNKDPDWTVGALVSEHNGNIIIHDITRFRRNAGGVEAGIAKQAYIDGPSVKIRMEQEPGASGKMTIDHYARHVLLGYDFAGHTTIRNKEARANVWAGKAQRGEVLLVDDLQSGKPWIQKFLDEVVTFGSVNNTSGVHDDQVDAISGAFEHLANLGEKIRGKVRIIV